MTDYPSRQRLLELFEFDPGAGNLYWRTTKAAGRLVGTQAVAGHLVVKVDGRQLCVHKIVWIILTGEHHAGPLRHYNGNRQDNRFNNLRPSSRREMAAEIADRPRKPPVLRKPISGASTSWLGVTPYEGGRYRARIREGKRMVFLGVFDTAPMAQEAFDEAARILKEGGRLALSRHR